MATYTKETALYDTGAIAQDIQEAGDQVNKYITAIGDDGIKVHPYNATSGAADAKNYTKIDSDGMEIWQDVNGTSTKVADFEASGTTIGQAGENRLELDYRSMELRDKENLTYFRVSDLRNEDGSFTEEFVATGLTSVFWIYKPDARNISVFVDGVDAAGTYSTSQTSDGISINFATPPNEDSVVKINYRLIGDLSRFKAFNFGQANRSIGRLSFAEGISVNALGDYSHAEGSGTTAFNGSSHAEGHYTSANGYASHAEGHNTSANGRHSHSQNTYTIAQRQSQTAIGEYNIVETGDSTTRGEYAFIIGNGTATTARSNALTVAWDGTVDIASGAKYKIGGTALAASDVGAVSDVQLNGTSIKSGTVANLLTSSLIDIFYPVGSYYDTSDSSFDPSTSLGGTWSSEEIVDDEIVEQGTNSIWTYRKWKSGIAECWGRRDITISLNNNYGGAYYGTDAVGFPTDLFSAEPTVSISRQGRQGTGLVHISPYSVSSTQIQYFITNTNGRYDSAPIGIAINARGLWKTYSAPSKKYRWHRTA